MTRSEFELMAPKLRAEMLKVSLAFFGDGDDAEDTVQEAMLQLWRYCGQIDSGRNVTGLAVRVAKNCCVNHYRRKRQEHANLDDCLAAFPDPSMSPQERLEEKDTRRMMHEAIARLKPRERQLFELRQMEELSTEEISAQTGILKSSVSAMVSAARKKVYEELLKRTLAHELLRPDIPEEWQAVRLMLGELAMGEAAYDEMMTKGQAPSYTTSPKRPRGWMTALAVAASLALLLLLAWPKGQEGNQPLAVRGHKQEKVNDTKENTHVEPAKDHVTTLEQSPEQNAVNNIESVMGTTMIDYVIASLAETTLMDVFEYGKQADKDDKPEFEG